MRFQLNFYGANLQVLNLPRITFSTALESSLLWTHQNAQRRNLSMYCFPLNLTVSPFFCNTCNRRITLSALELLGRTIKRCNYLRILDIHLLSTKVVLSLYARGISLNTQMLFIPEHFHSRRTCRQFHVGLVDCIFVNN